VLEEGLPPGKIHWYVVALVEEFIKLIQVPATMEVGDALNIAVGELQARAV
jgi:hypothetical protein